VSKRIYVGSLPYSVTDQQLEDLFRPYGQINEVHLITDKYTGQSKGFAFVEMANEEEANRAIQQLNGAEMGGRTLVVNEARERQEIRSSRSSGYGNRPRGGGGGRRRW